MGNSNSLKQTKNLFCEKGHIMYRKENANYSDINTLYCKNCDEYYELIEEHRFDVIKEVEVKKKPKF